MIQEATSSCVGSAPTASVERPQVRKGVIAGGWRVSSFEGAALASSIWYGIVTASTIILIVLVILFANDAIRGVAGTRRSAFGEQYYEALLLFVPVFVLLALPLAKFWMRAALSAKQSFGTAVGPSAGVRVCANAKCLKSNPPGSQFCCYCGQSMECDEMRVEQALENLRKNAELEEKNVRVKEQATTDALKGLANRACFDAFMCEQFDAIAPGKPLTMLMFDLDKFKSICDAYGHCTGDEVIQRVAVVLITASRYQDMCPPSSLAAAGRYGREEMFLILPGTTRATGARIADTIRRAVALETVEAGEQTIRITVSVGVATAEWGGRLTTPAHLIKAADLAIDAAKHEGGNCVKVCALPANPPAEDQAVGVDPRMDQDAEAVGNASPPNFAKA